MAERERDRDGESEVYYSEIKCKRVTLPSQTSSEKEACKYYISRFPQILDPPP